MADEAIAPMSVPLKCLMRPPPQVQSLVGKRFGRLVAIGYSHSNSRRETFWWFDCDCGARKEISGTSVSRGSTLSCGCIQREAAAELGRRSLGKRGLKGKGNLKHGRTGTRIYRIICNMIDRCHNPTCHAYPDYGARGIYVCDEWRTDKGAFIRWAEANGYADELQIDRIDNNQGYYPGNCRWVSPTVNANNRRNSRYVDFKGRRLTVAQWSRELGIDRDTLRSRLVDRGWSTERALTTVGGGRKRQTD